MMMKMVYSINSAIILILISMTGGADCSLNDCLELKDSVSTKLERGFFEADVAEDTDCRQGGGGPAADRSQDLREQLAAPPVQYEYTFSKRTKRDRPLLSRDTAGNNYRHVPDWTLVRPPAPGIGLDERIYISNDGRYHGTALRYTGADADMMSTTEISPIKIWRTTSEPSSLNISRLDLKMIQSRINRMRLDTTSVAPRRLTTPLLAWIQDPNFQTMATMGPFLMENIRRMSGLINDEDKPGRPPTKMFLLNPFNVLPYRAEVPPYVYSPNAARSGSTLRYEPITVPPKHLSPLELFRRLYATTTKPRIRTRKPRPKTPSALRILPMKDDEYIPEENEDQDTTTINYAEIQDTQEEIDKRRLNISRSKAEGEESDTNIQIINTPEEEEKGYEGDVKNMSSEGLMQLKSTDKEPIVLGKTKFEKFDRPEFADDKESLEHLKPFILTEVEEPINYRKSNIDAISKPAFRETDSKKLFPEFKQSVDIKQLGTPELRSQKDLEQDLILLKPPKLIPLKELSNEKEKDDVKSGKSLSKLMKIPIFPAKQKQFEEMNEDLKALLMPDDESYETPKTLVKLKEAEYGDLEEIKGIPIRRRRSVRYLNK